MPGFERTSYASAMSWKPWFHNVSRWKKKETLRHFEAVYIQGMQCGLECMMQPCHVAWRALSHALAPTGKCFNIQYFVRTHCTARRFQFCIFAYVACLNGQRPGEKNSKNGCFWSSAISLALSGWQVSAIFLVVVNTLSYITIRGCC